MFRAEESAIKKARSKLDATNSTEFLHEALRVDAVRRYGILDTPSDVALDTITAIAARQLGAPVAAISIVDTNRIWFKSHYGLDISEIPRFPGFCSSAVMQDLPWLIPDARNDPRASTNPLAVGRFGLQFYLGIPLRTPDGYNLGTLHVMDREPRVVGRSEVGNLSDLANVVMHQLEVQAQARRAATERDAAYRHVQLLTREIDHRVMNSLNLIASLLHLQSAHLKGTEAGLEIAKAAGKIVAIAHVHQHMQEPDGDGAIDCAAYLKRLCDGLSQIMGTEKNIKVTSASMSLSSETTGRIGLIVNELVTNAFKYGAISVEVEMRSPEGGRCRLTVMDDGAGLPTDFKIGTGSGLGMKVISSLAQALGGGISSAANHNRAGSTFEVVFPCSGTGKASPTPSLKTASGEGGS